MKILFFSSYFYPYLSGITTYPLKLLKYLKKHNFQITALTFKHDQKLKVNEIIDGIKVIRMPFLFRLSKGFISPQSFFYFWQELKKTELVFVNIPNGEGLALLLLAKLMGKKCLAHFHCQVFLNNSLFNGILACLININIFIECLLLDKIVVYSQDYFDSLPLFQRFKDKTVAILPPVEKLTINNDYLHKLKSIKKDKIWLGFAGRIAREKGLEYVIKAIKELNSSKLELVIAGPYGKDVVGEEKYFEKIKDLLEENQIHYHLLGKISVNQLAAFYSCLDLFVLTSINQTEAFGMVQVEAMQFNKPVIATDLPGVRVPIKTTQMGLLVKPKNISALMNAITQVLKNPQKFANTNNLQKVNLLFNPETNYQQYLRLITSL